jgi:hypothetical protein
MSIEFLQCRVVTRSARRMRRSREPLGRISIEPLERDRHSERAPVATPAEMRVRDASTAMVKAIMKNGVAAASGRGGRREQLQARRGARSAHSCGAQPRRYGGKDLPASGSCLPAADMNLAAIGRAFPAPAGMNRSTKAVPGVSWMRSRVSGICLPHPRGMNGGDVGGRTRRRTIAVLRRAMCRCRLPRDACVTGARARLPRTAAGGIGALESGATIGKTYDLPRYRRPQ